MHIFSILYKDQHYRLRASNLLPTHIIQNIFRIYKYARNENARIHIWTWRVRHSIRPNKFAGFGGWKRSPRALGFILVSLSIGILGSDDEEHKKNIAKAECFPERQSRTKTRRKNISRNKNIELLNIGKCVNAARFGRKIRRWNFHNCPFFSWRAFPQRKIGL